MDIYGIVVPYKPSTNFELLDFAEKLDLGLRGVFMRDNLPAFHIKKNAQLRILIRWIKAGHTGFAITK